MEMEKAAKEAEAAHIPGDVWVWLPDRRCLVDQHVAASYREKNPLPESLATHPLAKVHSAKASRAQVRWCFAEASNAV